MQYINSRQVPPEACLVRDIFFSRHLLRRASYTKRGVCWPCDPGTYHHELNRNDNDTEFDIEGGPLGATILQISTSILLKLVEHGGQLEA